MNWFIGICAMVLINGEPACRLIREIQCVNEAQCIRSLEAMHVPSDHLAYYYAAAAALPPSPKEPREKE